MITPDVAIYTRTTQFWSTDNESVAILSALRLDNSAPNGESESSRPSSAYQFFHNSAPVSFPSPYAYVEVDANLFVALVFPQEGAFWRSAGYATGMRETCSSRRQTLFFIGLSFRTVSTCWTVEPARIGTLEVLCGTRAFPGRILHRVHVTLDRDGNPDRPKL